MEKNKLPKGWKETHIGIISDVVSGIGFPKLHQGKKQEKYPFYKVGDISKTVQSKNLWLDKSDNYISENTRILLKGKPVPKGTIVFAKIGEALKLNRRAITSIESLFDNNVMGLIPKKIIDVFYLYYFFTTIKLENISRATTVPSIRKGDVESILIPLPPLNEQKRIEEKIEELLSLIDFVLENLTKIKKQIIQYRYSFYDEIFSSLETNSLRSCCDLIAGQHIQKNDYNISKNGMPYLTGPADFTHKYAVVSKWTTSPKAIAKKGDILITVKGAGVGKTNILNIKEASISRQLMAVRPHELSSHFVYSYFKSKFYEFQKMGQSTTVPGISKELILNFPLPVVDSIEQEKITNQLESSQSVILNSTQIIEDLVKICSSLKSSILKQAFEGKLVPQDPNDEPAPELLKRIKNQ